MVGIFDFKNIEFKKHEQEDSLVVTGEIANRSGKSYNAVAFRIIVFLKNIPIGNATFTINAFSMGQTKKFTKQIGGLAYSAVIKDINRCEIYAESAY